MIDPSWLADILTGLVLATAAYCAGRIVISLARGRRIELDADITHILMGIGMAGMFVTQLAILDTAAWSVIFGLVAAWYVVHIVLERGHDGARWAGLRHHTGHAVSALAMLYMFLAVPAGASTSSTGGMSAGSMGSGMSTGSGMAAHAPTLALLFAALLFGYTVLVADRIPLTAKASVAVTASPTAGDGDETCGGSGPLAGRVGLEIGRGSLLAPRGAALCEVVMSVAMGVMLIAML